MKSTTQSDDGQAGGSSVDQQRLVMPYAKRRTVKARRIAARKRERRLRAAVANEYKRLRAPYLMCMKLMKAAIALGQDVSPDEVEEYRKKKRSEIRKGIHIILRSLSA